MFWSFQAKEMLEGIENSPGGLGASLAWLPENEHRNLTRAREISEEAESQFTPEQNRQLKRGRWKVTWTGRSIAELAKECGTEVHKKFHVPMYGVMSMAAPGSPGMIHWSYKLLENGEEAVQHTHRCMSQSAEWLDRGSIMVFRSSQKFLQVYGIALSGVGAALDTELDALRAGSADRREEEEGLRSDPTIRDLIERIVNAVHPLRIILFGSAARGDDHAHSDLDVLVIVPDRMPMGQAEDAMYRCMWGFGIPVDLIAITEEQLREQRDKLNLVVHSAVKDGQGIYRAAG